MNYAVKILRFRAIKFFVFQVQAFKFSKFHGREAKLDKGNFNTGLAVIFKVKYL